MAQGWIMLHRELSENWLWKDKEPFDKRSAWIDLLLMANHKEFKVQRNMHIVIRKRGEVNTSVVFLAKKWGWSRNKVYRFLHLLQEDGMIRIDGTADGTTITIENYEKYQITKTTDGTPHGTSDGTADGTSDGTYDNNDKECNNNGKEKRRGRFTPPTLQEVEDYIKEKGYHIDAVQFIDFYESKGWMIGKNKMKDWKAAVRTWEQRHGKRTNDPRRSEEERRRVEITVSRSGDDIGSEFRYPGTLYGVAQEG